MGRWRRCTVEWVLHGVIEPHGLSVGLRRRSIPSVEEVKVSWLLPVLVLVMRSSSASMCDNSIECTGAPGGSAKRTWTQYVSEHVLLEESCSGSTALSVDFQNVKADVWQNRKYGPCVYQKAGVIFSKHKTAGGTIIEICEHTNTTNTRTSESDKHK